MGVGQVDGLGAVGRGENLVSVPGEDALSDLAEGGFVLDHEDGGVGVDRPLLAGGSSMVAGWSVAGSGVAMVGAARSAHAAGRPEPGDVQARRRSTWSASASVRGADQQLAHPPVRRWRRGPAGARQSVPAHRKTRRLSPAAPYRPRAPRCLRPAGPR